MPPGIRISTNGPPAPQTFPSQFGSFGETSSDATNAIGGGNGSGGKGPFYNKYWQKFHERKEQDRHLIKSQYSGSVAASANGSSSDLYCSMSSEVASNDLSVSINLDPCRDPVSYSNLYFSFFS